jgi:hypothetical protein
MRFIASSLVTPDHTFSPALLYNIAHLRTQHSFTHAVFSFIETIALGPTSILTDLARATWIASAAPGATSLFSTYSIPAAIALTDKALRTLYCIRLALVPPGVPAQPNHPIYCNANCNAYSEAIRLFRLLCLSPRAASASTSTDAEPDAAARSAMTPS